jgi:cell division protein FtsB
MASTARRAAAPRARRASGGRPSSRGRPGVGTAAISLRGIRWDRVARLSLLMALALVLLLYVKPATRYFEAWQLSRDTRTEVKDLRADNAALRARSRELKRSSRVELEARRLGMARPGERVYVVRGLPR